MNLEALVREKLCDPRPDEVALGVVDHDALTGWSLAVHGDLLGRQHVRRARSPRRRSVRACPPARRRPTSASRSRPPRSAHRSRGRRRPTAGSRVTTATFGSLSSWICAPVHDPAPVAERRQPSDPPHPAADLRLGLDEVDRLEPALAERDRALHPGRPGADDQHRAIGVRRALEPLGMPPAPMLLAGGGVLDAAEMPVPVDLHDADVRAGAFADLVGASLGDLLRQERVGDRRPRAADQVERRPIARSTPSDPGRSAAPRPRSAWPSPRGPAPSTRAGTPPRSSATSRSPCSSTRSSRRSRPTGPPGRRPARRTRAPRPRGYPAGPSASTAIRVTTRSRPRPPPSRARASPARTAPGARGSRRTRRSACCRRPRGTAWAGTSARRTRRRCRTRSRAPASPPRPSRPGRGGYR